MTHEMLRSEAEEHGYGTAGKVMAPGATRDDDVIDVWAELPDADDHNPPEAA